MTVEEMLGRISSRELTEWIAYDQDEPIGDRRGDLQNAILCALIANINRDPDKKSEPFTPADFIVNFWELKESQPEVESWKANLQMAEVITIALGGQDLREGR